MKELFRAMRAELVKMRHTFLYPLHFLVPALGSTLFLLYYHVAKQSEIAQISGYAEVIGIALPFVISIVCAWNVELEEKNRFQTFLGGTVRKWNSFLAKYLILAGMGVLAVALAVFLFAAGCRYMTGKGSGSYGIYGQMTAALCLGCIPLYLEHLFLNLRFPKQVSLCIGVAQFLLSALFLTGLGDGRWPYFPCTWSARGAALVFFMYEMRKEMEDTLTAEIRGVLLVCVLMAVMIYAIIRIWFYFYEGRKYND